MEKIQPKKRSMIYISQKSKATIIAVVAFLILVLVNTTAHTLAEKIKCSSFAAMEDGYEKAQLALKDNPGLDGDHDGFACDKLKK